MQREREKRNEEEEDDDLVISRERKWGERERVVLFFAWMVRKVASSEGVCLANHPGSS